MKKILYLIKQPYTKRLIEDIYTGCIHPVTEVKQLFRTINHLSIKKLMPL